MYYNQKNITLTQEQQDFLKLNHGKISMNDISKMLGIGYGKTVHNARLLGLGKYSHRARVVRMDGYFDEETFFKQYRY